MAAEFRNKNDTFNLKEKAIPFIPERPIFRYSSRLWLPQKNHE